jgi:hypothetical protein
MKPPAEEVFSNKSKVKDLTEGTPVTIQSRNYNLKNDTKYARHRSAGANEVYLNNVIQSLQNQNFIINTYDNSTSFGAFWGSCQVNRNLRDVRPNKYRLVNGSVPGGPLGNQMTQTIKTDMNSIWKDLGKTMSLRGLGPGGGNHGVNSGIWTAHSANGTHLHILVYKGRPPNTVQNPAHEGDYFYHFEMTDP